MSPKLDVVHFCPLDHEEALLQHHGPEKLTALAEKARGSRRAGPAVDNEIHYINNITPDGRS